MFQIEIGKSGNYRNATGKEDRAIHGHIQEYPECDGSQMRDNGGQTLMITPLLRCVDCRVNVKVRDG